MGKGVSNIWRFFQVGSEANNRYLTALGNVELKGKALKDIENLCQSVTKKNKRYAKFNPLTENDLSLFRSVLSGAHTINGFRNCDVCRNYFEKSASTREEAKRRCARISRMIAKLRGHGLVVKLKNSNRYRISPKGYRVMSAIVAIKEITFPVLYAKAS